MSRIIAFGCSLTYGHGLPDCFVPPMHYGPKASNFAWPSVIANKLGIQCVNVSTPGSSNKRIWHNIINFNFKKDDIVFVLWSYEDRSCLLKNKRTAEDIGSWMETTAALSYYKNNYSKYDSLMQSKIFVSHANFLLKEKNITLYNLATKKSSSNIFNLSGQVVPYIPLYIDDTYQNLYPTALDGCHPGQECHKVFANDIMHYLNMSTNLNPSRPTNFIGKIKLFLRNNGSSV